MLTGTTLRQSKPKKERLNYNNLYNNENHNNENHNNLYNNENNYINNIRIDQLTKENKNIIRSMKFSDRYKYFCEDVIPLLPTKSIKDNSAKYLLRFHGGSNNTSDTFKIPKNFYIISLEKGGLFYSTKIIDYLILRMGMLNNISKEFFKNITEEIFYTETHKLNNEYHNYIEEKHFKIYHPETDFYNYKLETEENNNFLSGLFKLPIKPFFVNNNDNIIEINNEKNISNLDCIINPFKYNCIKNGKLLHKNDYYTLHCKYLNDIKKYFKSKEVDYGKDIKKYMKCLSNHVKTIKENNTSGKQSIINLSDIVTFLDNKNKKINSKNPVILILFACTLKEEYEYLQNRYLKYNFNRKTRFNYMNYLNNNNRFIPYYEMIDYFNTNNPYPNNSYSNNSYNNNYNGLKELYFYKINEFLEYIKNELNLDINNIDKINSFTLSLLEKNIKKKYNNLNDNSNNGLNDNSNNGLNDNSNNGLNNNLNNGLNDNLNNGLNDNSPKLLKLLKLFNNFIYYRFIYINTSYNNTYTIFNLDILKKNFDENVINFIKVLLKNIIKYYILLILLYFKKDISIYEKNYKKNFEDIDFFYNIFLENDEKIMKNNNNNFNELIEKKNNKSRIKLMSFLLNILYIKEENRNINSLLFSEL